MEAQKHDVVKFDELPVNMQLSIDVLKSSRRKKRLYSLTGREHKCEGLAEKIWQQYNSIANLAKEKFGDAYTHFSIYQTGDLILLSDEKHAGKAYETANILRVPI